jgi:UDP-N-acetylmuramoyl-L-alanyl-D-glutamate--2,6-diaminopimelate ligase
MEVSPLSLRHILGPASFVSTGDIVASRFCTDSRRIRPGDVFVAIRGVGFDGHHFIEMAAASGAAAVIAERPHPRIHLPQCIVADSRAAYSKLCLEQHGRPQQSLNICGVTGTNGKTTTTWVLRSILESAGLRTGLLGTIEYSNGREHLPASLTTPGSQDTARWLRNMVDAGTTHCVMELSSHALDQRRCSGIELSAAALTNITQDHFDYHGGMDAYVQAKARIASHLQDCGALLIGIDDPGCREAIRHIPDSVRMVSFGIQEPADLRAEILKSDLSGQTLRLSLQSGSIEVCSRLTGRHNAMNLLTAAGLAEQMSIGIDAIGEGIEQVECVPGRMESIRAGQKFSVFVDYAHTPDGIRHAINTVRSHAEGRVILVFGAGGNRDRSKRPQMAKAAEAADLIVVTSDNPRFEPIDQILEEICEGFSDLRRVQVCPDREKALQFAIRSAMPDDSLIIAGRGHETVQQIRDRQICFDDRKVVLRLLQERMAAETDRRHHAEAIPA